MKYILIIMLIARPVLVHSQQKKDGKYLEGKVFQKDSLAQSSPISYANVYWQQTNEGVITDANGSFKIQYPSINEPPSLIVSFVGLASDTILIDKQQAKIDIYLEKYKILDEVSITKNRATTINSKISLMSSQLITEVGLQKLACCNIGESFESNATIDVGFSDAVSGAKKIRMLGLDGKYSQFLFENIPFMRGLESGFGLSHIPGPFMQSIQVSKGTSSVINGYESTTGQINVEYKKPADTDLLYVNLFANTEGRYEGNITSGTRINDNWAGMIFLHTSMQNSALDHNSDGFYDRPLQKQYNFLNRWEYNPDGFLHLQFGVEVVDEERTGGQLNYKGRDSNPDNLYGIDVDLSKVRVFSKLGYAFRKDPNKSIGWINSITYFDQKTLFGSKEYDGNMASYFSNLIWQTQMPNPNHKLSSGISFQYDNYEEKFLGTTYLKEEFVSGIFSQYTFSIPEKLVFMTGLRADINSEYGALVTPRIHLKYSINENYILRSTLGKAYRSPNIFQENMSLLASSRDFVFNEELKIERAWNTGISLSRYFHLDNQRDLALTIDFFRTSFQDQMVVDLDQNVSEVNIYNLKGESYSNSFQADLTGEIFKSFDMTLAYRYNDVKLDYLDGNMEQAFSNKHKALFTTSYKTRFDKWKFDYTVQYNGSKRLPDTSENPEEFKMEAYSPAYFMHYAQITKKLKHFELYVGAENLGSYIQEKTILDPINPFGDYFDATMVWGPVSGRMFYGGLRFKIK